MRPARPAVPAVVAAVDSPPPYLDMPRELLHAVSEVDLRGGAAMQSAQLGVPTVGTQAVPQQRSIATIKTRGSRFCFFFFFSVTGREVLSGTRVAGSGSEGQQSGAPHGLHNVRIAFEALGARGGGSCRRGTSALQGGSLKKMRRAATCAVFEAGHSLCSSFTRV